MGAPRLNLDAWLTWHGHDPRTVTAVTVLPADDGAQVVEVTHRLKVPATEGEH